MDAGSSVSDAPVLMEKSDGVARVQLNRPKQFNALSEELLRGLLAAIEDIAADESVRCVVLSAVGRAFCSGHDLREMRAKPSLDYYRDLFAQCSAVMQRIQGLKVPVIARVQGVATAAGCQLVASCDLAIASQSAKFAVSGISVGLFCSTPAVALSRNISNKRAFDLLVTGRFIEAETAADWGLVNEAVPDVDLDSAVARKVLSILGKSRVALRYGKAMYYKQRQMALADAYELASDVMAHNMMEEDAAEGIDAFLGKRAPVWVL